MSITHADSAKPLPDFLADDHQPTEDTVRALWYLQQFFHPQASAEHERWQGVAFADALAQCRLDFSVESLSRIDRMLDTLRDETSPVLDDFFSQIEKRNFLFLLTFYCGELVGRARRQATIWWDYERYCDAYPQRATITERSTYTLFVCHYPARPADDHDEGSDGTSSAADDAAADYFPLVAIIDRLFAAQPTRSVRASARVFMPGGLDVNAPLPEPPAQALNVRMPALLARTPQDCLPYLQMLPSYWMWDDPLLGQLEQLGHLYRKGRVVWAAVVQANKLLFDPECMESCPAEIIYDPSGRTNPDSLSHMAQGLFTLKVPDDELATNPLDAWDDEGSDEDKLALYGKHLSHERTRLFTQLNISHMPVKSAGVFLWRPHLPNGILSMPYFPVLISDETNAVTLLPARYWRHSQFYQDWFAQQDARNQAIATTGASDRKLDRDTTLGFAALTQAYRGEATADIWQDFAPLLYPQPEEFPPLAPAGTPDPALRADERPNPDTMGKQLIQGYLDAPKRAYHRYWENQRPSSAAIQACMTDLQARRHSDADARTRLYAQFAVFDYRTLLNELASPQHNRAFRQQLLPDIARLLAGEQLTSLQISEMMKFLKKESEKGAYQQRLHERQSHKPLPEARNNTTALLYLAYLALSGRFGRQSLDEGVASLRYAAELGDGRATKLIAELRHAIPQAAKLLGDKKVSPRRRVWPKRLLKAVVLVMGVSVVWSWLTEDEYAAERQSLQHIQQVAKAIKSQLPKVANLDDQVRFFSLDARKTPITILVQGPFQFTPLRDIRIPVERARAIYCGEPLFRKLRTLTPVTLVFTKIIDGHRWYEVTVTPEQCH